MSEKILVTGFDRFGYARKPNRSSEVGLERVKERYADLVETLVLPTARDVAAQKLATAIEDIDPAAVVMFGISAGSKVRLEERAKNWKYNILIPDNNGKRAFGRIDPTGQSSIDSSLPLEELYERLDAAQVPVKISKDAGSFICNEVMYKTLQHNTEREDGLVIPTGFIHFGNGLNDQMIEEASLAVVDELIRYGSGPAN